MLITRGRPLLYRVTCRPRPRPFGPSPFTAGNLGTLRYTCRYLLRLPLAFTHKVVCGGNLQSRVVARHFAQPRLSEVLLGACAPRPCPRHALCAAVSYHSLFTVSAAHTPTKPANKTPRRAPTAPTRTHAHRPTRTDCLPPSSTHTKLDKRINGNKTLRI